MQATLPTCRPCEHTDSMHYVCFPARCESLVLVNFRRSCGSYNDNNNNTHNKLYLAKVQQEIQQQCWQTSAVATRFCIAQLLSKIVIVNIVECASSSVLNVHAFHTWKPEYMYETSVIPSEQQYLTQNNHLRSFKVIHCHVGGVEDYIYCNVIILAHVCESLEDRKIPNWPFSITPFLIDVSFPANHQEYPSPETRVPALHFCR